MTTAMERAATTPPAPAPDRLDSSGIDALYRADRDRLLRIATKVAPTRDAGEDAVQEAFVRLLADPDRVRIPQAFVTSQAKFGALAESSHRGRQKPAGDAIDRLADTASPADADDGEQLAHCMGDPATAAQVKAALATLPDRDGVAVELHCLEGRRVSDIAQQLGVSKATVYNMINRSMTRLREQGVPVSDEQLAGDADPADDVQSPDQPTTEDLAATLAKEVGECRIGVDSAEVVLRRVYGSCPRNQAYEAKTLHNARLSEGAPSAVVRPETPDEMPDSLRARLDDARALLGQVAAGRQVSYADVSEILREHGRGRASKMVAAAARLHNEPLPQSAPRYLDRPNKRYASKPPSEHQVSTAAAVRKPKPNILRAAALLRSTYGATPPDDLPSTGELARRHGWDGAIASYARSAYIEGLDLETPTAPAQADSAVEQPGPLVTEAWLRWADAEITCMFVRDDESTARHPVTFRSMSGAQREVTGLLVDDGYRPVGPWVGQVDDESMRGFTHVDARRAEVTP